MQSNVQKAVPKTRVSFIKALLAVALALVVGLGLWVALTSLQSRAVTYAKFCTLWEHYWPLDRGSYIPTRLGPMLDRLGIVRPVRIELEPGISFKLNPVDSIDMQLLTTGVYEPDVWEWIAEDLKPGGTFVDVGAHIGAVTIRAAKTVGKSGHVLAVEPHPVNAARLRENVIASGWEGVVSVQQYACADKPGELKLFDGSGINSGVASLSKENAVSHGASGERWFDVAVLPLDDIAAKEIDHVQVLKIDTEGADTQVLRGAHKLIAGSHPAIVIETIDAQLKNMGSSLQELEDVLRGMGYKKVKQSTENAKWVFAS